MEFLYVPTKAKSKPFIFLVIESLRNGSQVILFPFSIRPVCCTRRIESWHEFNCDHFRRVRIDNLYGLVISVFPFFISVKSHLSQIPGVLAALHTDPRIKEQLFFL
jgi:hypothetical protein